MTLATLPGLRGLPLLGNLRDFKDDRLGFFLRLSAECGDIGRIQFGPKRFVFLNAANLIQTVLVDHAYTTQKTSTMRKLLHMVVGDGLLNAEGAHHKRQRKLIAPAFQHRRIVSYAPVMTTSTMDMIARWSDGTVLDIAAEMMRLTLGIIGKTLFDANVFGESSELALAQTTAVRYANDAVNALFFLPLTWPTPHNLHMRRAITRLNMTVHAIIHARRQSEEDRGDLLAMLLQAYDQDDGTRMTDTQVRDEVMTLLLAGHENTANALTWCLYLLTQHPDVYSRLRSEVDQTLAGRPLSYDDLAQLPYTLQIIKEALRLYPPAYMTGRKTLHPFDLAGYHLPTGTTLVISPYTLHRRPDYFPDPERFDPDRFSLEREAQLPRGAYIPFGAGPRVCIGNHFALMEAQIILATLAQHVSFELAPGQHVVPEPLITLRPRGGIKMIVRRK